MLPAVFLHTYDTTMAGEWRAAFKFVGAVQVVEEDILSGRADAVVGQATIVHTDHEAFPYLVSAPTMRVPDRIGDTVLIAVLRHNQGNDKPICTIRIPSLGTGVGGMSPKRAAFQMHAAYESILGRPAWGLDPSAILVHHEDLRLT